MRPASLALLVLWVNISPLLAQDKSSLDTTRQFLLKSAREIIHSSGKVALITQDENGTSQIRTMDPFEPEPDFTVWLATNPNSRKVNQIKNDSNVVLYYLDKNDNGYVVIHGRAELIDDQKEKDKRWKNEWKNFYPNRTDAYLLIKITPRYLELINYPRGISGDPTTWQPAMVRFEND